MKTNNERSVVGSNLPTLLGESGFQRYIKEVNNIPSLTKEEEFMLAKSYLEEKDINAAQKLVSSHLKLVVKIAMSFRNYGLPVTELVSEGNVGLMHAVKKYNPDLGYRLSTYAMWWIKAAIQEYVLKSWSLVKIGTTSAQKKLFFSLNKIKNKLMNLYGRQIGVQDYNQIASELDVSVRDVEEMNTRLSGGDLSLNASVYDDESGDEMQDYIADKTVDQESKLVAIEDISNKRSLLINALKELNERELDIIKCRKLAVEPATLDDLSQKYNISKERVRQIEARAFEKVQKIVLANSEALNY